MYDTYRTLVLDNELWQEVDIGVLLLHEQQQFCHLILYKYVTPLQEG